MKATPNVTESSTGSSATIWNPPIRVNATPDHSQRHVPSCCGPATCGERAQLRRIGKLASTALEIASPAKALQAAVKDSLSGGRGEFRLLVCLALVAAQALTFGIASLTTFVMRWNSFVELIRKLVV